MDKAQPTSIADGAVNADHALVSVVIPTCERRPLLARCLEALTRQTYPCYEVIVVDDFSADDTFEFLRAFGAAHAAFPLRMLRNDSHKGANPSRNRGVRESRGDFVAFLDSDCIAEPDWLTRLVAGLGSPRVAAVSGRVVDTPARNLYELTFRGTHRLHRPGPTHRLIAGNMCVRRDLLYRHGLDEDRAGPLRNKVGRPDVSVSGRGDEEGLYLRLRAAGHEVHYAPDAVVLHEYTLDGGTLFRQGFRGGRSAAVNGG